MVATLLPHPLLHSHLLAQYPGTDRGLEDKIFQDGGKGRHPNASPHQHRHFKLVPLLMSLSKRSVQVQLQRGRNEASPTYSLPPLDDNIIGGGKLERLVAKN